MKKLTALILALALLLCGCGAAPAPTEAATQATTEAPTEAAPPTEAPTEASTEAPTEEPTTEPEELVYTNPLNGETLEEPYTGRIFGVVISNIRGAIPHVGVQEADIFMEMFANDSVIRCFALYTDVTKAETVGPLRSMRLMFNDISQHYNLIPCYAGGSTTVTRNLNSLGLEHIHVDTWDSYQFGASFRDKGRNQSLGYEHCLMLDTDKLVEYAASLDCTLESEGKDYGLLFTQDGTPQGEAAQEINIRFKYRSTTKDTTMKYDEAAGKYVFWQYNKEMVDGETKEPHTFQNVVVVDADITIQYSEGVGYYKADFLKGGTGYYACGGQIIPITWTCEADGEPLRFFTQDGEPLYFGVGNTYMAIVPRESPVTWK